MDRADGHGFQRVDFLADLHGAELGGKGGTGAANNDNGGNERTEFAGHGDGHGAGHKGHGAKALEFVGGLQREDQADEKGNERKDGESAHTHFHGLGNGALEANGLALKRADEGGPSGAAAYGRESSEIRQ